MRWLPSLLLLLSLKAYSQEDSLVIYFNRAAPADIKAGERLLADYKIKDSIKIFWVASKISRKENKVDFYHSVGDRFNDADDYETARFYYTRALKFARLTLNREMMADQLASTGDMLRLQDLNTDALGLLFQAMYIYKELNNEERLSHTLLLIGDLQRCVDQPEDAIRYLDDGLKIATKNNLTDDQTFGYSSLGATYQLLGEYDKAYASYGKGLQIATELKDTMRLIDFNYSIGDLLVDKGEPEEAINYLNRGIKLCEYYHEPYNLAFCHIGLAKAYLKKKDFDRSVQEGLIAYNMGHELKAKGFNIEASDVLFEAYAGKSDFKNAYRYLKIIKDNNDSTLSSTKIKQQATQEINFKNAYQEKQDSLLRFAQQKQKDLEHGAELQQQKIVAIIGIAGLVIALLIVGMVYRSYKKEKRSSEIIHKQKLVVDAKNKEVLDSINYAKKIQQAIIPSYTELRNVFPESFVLLLPKDIVSGDFYWVIKTGQQAFFAVVDCTGHGVPGGFMSMLGTALLNEIINEKNIYEPADILDMLKLKIIMSLRQSENMSESRDGMDIALTRLNLNTMELSFAGANNSLYVLQGGKLKEFKGDKFPIGIEGTFGQQFTQHKIKLAPGDMLYMFTDGYPDQFGGPAGKKYKYKPLEELLVKVSSLPVDEQREQLIKEHNNWKGDQDQVDDICVAGIRIQ
ncbi:MAG TPA: SpoIIE family protein phosphatase [Bacteroidia bacterium]|jgi:serine phosphatase RsbU (regulator of sigma subunit)